jgi:hypothetical protein
MEKDDLVHKGSKVEKLSKKFNARAMKFYDDTLTDFSFLCPLSFGKIIIIIIFLV